jgi:hypothetical protein
MTEPRKFDEQTHWDQDPGGGGWVPPGDDFFIDRADPYWGRVLDKARHSYGDPNMRFDTDDVWQQRRLVFGDGTAVPDDGSLAYHDAANNKTYLLNSDGTVSPLGTDGHAGQPISPSGFRATGDGAYAPVEASGHQVAPLLSGAPPTPNGYHDEHGVLTPKNARGDYYVDDPAGSRRYFDAAGKPITKEQFNGASPASPGLPTDEQQSGRAADAVKKLHEELQNRYSQLSDAETQLSEVLLTAHATTADGQQKLQQIQHTIVEAVNNPALALDTPAGEQAFLKLLRGQVAAIGDVVKSGALSAEDQSKAVEALTNLYAADHGAAPTSSTPDAPTATPAADPAPVDAGLGPEEPMPDPSLSDLGLGGTTGTDPLASLASALPAAMGAFPPGGMGAGWGADPLSSLGGLAGVIPQLAGLAQQGEPPRREESGGGEPVAEKNDGGDSKPQPPQADNGGPPPPPPEPAGAPGDGAPPAAANPAPIATTSVALPDGSTATAKTAAVARAVESYLSGTPVDAAYRAAGIDLPPPGTPVTAPIDPSALSCGAIGMFKDHYVVALSSVKALQDGQVVPLSSVASGPDFLGWMDPAASPAQPVAAVPPAV